MHFVAVCKHFHYVDICSSHPSTISKRVEFNGISTSDENKAISQIDQGASIYSESMQISIPPNQFLSEFTTGIAWEESYGKFEEIISITFISI